ncbi:hypothetical protein WN944_012272 [Citrus x changshan-huyou]|uniref:Uncharacterized protein n=1 Tax=Citrus x changshan-huyou TaxID=2935761 RepID=A0AAP0MUW7_9ROSI
MEGSGTVCLNMQKQSESTNCNELDAVGNALVATVKKITVAHRQQQCWIHPKKKQGWHEDDRRRTSFQSVPTLVVGVAGNGDKIRVGFVGIVIKRGVL